MSLNTQSHKRFSQNQQIVFMHLPKTAGTFIWHCLKRVYAGQITHLVAPHPETVMQQFESVMQNPSRTTLIGGHLLFGYNQLIDPSLSVFTMLRDPVKRLISTYYYSTNNNHDPDNPITKGLISLEEWLPTVTNNFYIRTLNSLDSDEICTFEHLEIAQDIINNHIDFVGITKYFDESILLLKKYYNWQKFPFYENKNVGSYNREVSQKSQKIAEDKCDLDTILYNNLCQNFENKLKQQPSKFTRDLKRFQFVNQYIYPKRNLLKQVLFRK